MSCSSINGALFCVCNLARRSSVKLPSYSDGDGGFATTAESTLELIARARATKQRIEQMLIDPAQLAIFRVFYAYADVFNDANAIRLLSKVSSVTERFSLAELPLVVSAWRSQAIGENNGDAIFLLSNLSSKSQRTCKRWLKTTIDELENRRLAFYHDDYALACSLEILLKNEGFLKLRKCIATIKE
jgi:hypothetical protein